MEDVKLLDDVVATFHCARTVSRASDRLYGIGANFARVARGLVEAQKSCVGEYNKQEDTLQLPDDCRRAKADRPNPSQDQLGLDMMDYLTYPEAQDMSALFGTWDNGQPSALELFGLNGEDLM
ncbi:hypothetical protein N7468_002337 [Penicillium chermesinum]|uniref:Uncharacterized protein n=1 Tax=Penicillium chermesinum TaxID=63820 RepID=A0A9W9PIA4_9EURO|nr:uncharacterized protein N7468_002337 [Penicillium chermesinum]KAJ5247354.1 hypothetical protein N7468_002337 [Penicillium chermesinum]KAJ6145596.1 hypothetical protein N7470_009491 [Penicillium chermesinum]